MIETSNGRYGTRITAPSAALTAALTISVLGLATETVPPAHAGEPALASPWVSEQAARTRVIAGGIEDGQGGRRPYAGLEIELEDGWKTYWRNPGSSGVPPRIEIAGSENLAKAELLFPAPIRFAEKDGDTIGYKQSVVLPLRLEAIDPSKPIVLKIAAELGICREVCIPVQPSLSLVVPPDAAVMAPSAGLPSALARVPRGEGNSPATPRLELVQTTLSGDKPAIVLDVQFPGDATGADVFLEAPDGLWIPLPRAAGRAPTGANRFTVDLTDGADVGDLKGRTIRATLVTATNQAETSFRLVEGR